MESEFKDKKQRLIQLFKTQHNIDSVSEEFTIVLLPYDESFVEKYHTWMQDESIYKLVGCDEAMTLEEVKEAQILSQNDDEDCKLEY